MMLEELARVTPISHSIEKGPLLIALSQWEIDAFFPGDQAERLQSIYSATARVDPAQISPADWQKRLRTMQPRVIISCWSTPRLPADLKHLRYLCHLTGSVRGIVPRDLIVAGLKVTNWGTFAAPYVAEHALLLLLAALRSLPKWASAIDINSNPQHTANLQTRSLHGRRVSIHGFGQIARELIKLLEPFHVQVFCFSAGVPRQLILDHGATAVDSLEALADSAEIFVSCEALTEQTRESLGYDVLSRLEIGAVLVNVGRGAIVDESALAEVALKRNLRVASDVFAKEPLPANSPLRGLPNALYSPHIGGPTLDVYPHCGVMALENLRRYSAALPLEREVTPEVFDRST